LIVPLREPPKSSEATSPAADQASAALRIPCIDDEPLLRELLKELLEFHEHKVETADGGRSGLDAFQNARVLGQPFDVVITDLGMPDVNGRQVVEKIKADSPDTAVIMLTGWGAMLEERGEGVDKVDALLSKPPRANELIETLTKVTMGPKRKAAPVEPAVAA
jgi:YesN/AraC family two-component response regulator